MLNGCNAQTEQTHFFSFFSACLFALGSKKSLPAAPSQRDLFLETVAESVINLNYTACVNDMQIQQLDVRITFQQVQGLTDEAFAKTLRLTFKMGEALDFFIPVRVNAALLYIMGVKYHHLEIWS